MAQANASGGGSVSAPAGPADIRNVVLVGPSGAGKTTLLEAMLAATGTIPRAGRTTEGTTVSDFDEAEVRQQRSVGLALAPVVVDGVKVKIVCTAVQQIINALLHFKGNAVNYFKARPHIRHAGGGL